MNQSLYWRSLAESQCQKVCLDTVETDSAADVYVCGRIRFCVISVINYKVKNIPSVRSFFQWSKLTSHYCINQEDLSF